MQYMLMFRETTESFAMRQDPKASPAYWGAWMAYVGALRASGKVVNGDGLEGPQTAAIVRIRDGKRQVQDGPFPDTREHLDGYVVLDVGSLEEALEWAARAPCAAAGSIEVRPVMMPPPK
jgi:hypothetical protein